MIAFQLVGNDPGIVFVVVAEIIPLSGQLMKELQHILSHQGRIADFTCCHLSVIIGIKGKHAVVKDFLQLFVVPDGYIFLQPLFSFFLHDF